MPLGCGVSAPRELDAAKVAGIWDMPLDLIDVRSGSSQAAKQVHGHVPCMPRRALGLPESLASTAARMTELLHETETWDFFATWVYVRDRFERSWYGDAPLVNVHLRTA